MTFSEAELDRYARQIILKEVGGAGQLRLKAAHVVIVGAGGIGSPVIQYLAGAGVGRLTIYDDDVVALSNLHRQTIFEDAAVSFEKARDAAIFALALNPEISAVGRQMRLNASNVAEAISNCDVIVDGSDNFSTRLLVADSALAARIPLISAAVGQFEGQVAVYRGWEPDKPCYRCFVGNASDQADTSCAEAGVLGPVTGILGSLAALEAIRTITPFGEDPAGKLLLIDMLAWRFRAIGLPKDPGCPACGQTPA